LARGDQLAYAELYDRAADRLYHWLWRWCGRSDVAEDAVQDAFVRLARHRERLRGVADPIAYLFRTARNEGIRRLERENRDRARTTDLGDPPASGAATGIEQVDNSDWASALLGNLSDTEREVVELKIFGQLTFREIATVIELPQGTVATRYRDALARLRAMERRAIG
jgi:RNA polymerase sigma-70 factor (ECF subfamily)